MDQQERKRRPCSFSLQESLVKSLHRGRQFRIPNFLRSTPSRRKEKEFRAQTGNPHVVSSLSLTTTSRADTADRLGGIGSQSFLFFSLTIDHEVTLLTIAADRPLRAAIQLRQAHSAYHDHESCPRAGPPRGKASQRLRTKSEVSKSDLLGLVKVYSSFGRIGVLLRKRLLS